MKVFGNPVSLKNPQIKVVSNKILTKATSERTTLAELETPTENRRVTVIKCFYDDSIPQLEDILISVHLKDETFYLVLDVPLHILGNRKSKEMVFEKFVWKADSETDTIKTTATASIQIECSSPIAIPQDKIFFLFESCKALGNS